MFYADLVTDLTALLESRCSTSHAPSTPSHNFIILQLLLADCGYRVEAQNGALVLVKPCPKDSTLSSTPAKSDTNPALHNEYMEDFN